MKYAHPPIFAATLIAHRDSLEVMRVARSIVVAERPYYPRGKQTLGEFIDGRNMPDKHSLDL